MGISRETYYGPFLVYKPVTEKVTSLIRGCGKCNTENSSLLVDFCGKCGSKYELFIREKDREVYDFNDELYCPHREGKVRVVIPNSYKDIEEIRTAGGYSTFELDEYGEAHVVTLSSTRATNKFTELFAKHIESLAKLGAEPEVRFGVLNYYI